MATRMYFSSTATVSGYAPAFDAGWDATTSTRMLMDPTKDGSALTNFPVFTGAGTADGEDAGAFQLISRPLIAGIAFSTGDSVKGYGRVVESAADDNIRFVKRTLKVFSAAAALQATLVTFATEGELFEWPTALASRSWISGNLSAGYTTVAGDRLVLEIGAQTSGAGTTTQGQFNLGSSVGSDVAENENVTTALDPWFEISRTLTFFTPPDDAGGCLLTVLRRA